MVWSKLFLSAFCVNLQGVANRGCSIRVGRDTEKAGKGIHILTLWLLKTYKPDISPICQIGYKALSLSASFYQR